MKLIVLGSGTCVPSLQRNAPGYYVENDTVKALLDAGGGTLLQLERAGKSYRDIDALFLTHTHPDHISDLIPLIHALSAVPGHTREKDLTVVGPPGIGGFITSCVSTLLRKTKTFETKVVEIEDTFTIGSFHVFAAKTAHSHNSIAYRIEEDKKSLVYTGDADYDDGLVRLSMDADLLIADCSYPDTMKTPGHMTPRECGLVAERARVKKLVLSHIYPSPSPDEERITECRAVFNGDVVLAEDLMEFDI